MAKTQTTQKSPKGLVQAQVERQDFLETTSETLLDLRLISQRLYLSPFPACLLATVYRNRLVGMFLRAEEKKRNLGSSGREPRVSAPDQGLKGES
jgi:hypothetical protein